MKAYKVFAIKMEVEVDDETLQEECANQLEEMGETIDEERLFQNYLDSFQMTDTDWLTEQIMDVNPYILKVSNLEVFEIL